MSSSFLPLKAQGTEIFRIKDADFLPFVLHLQTLITPLVTNVDFIPYGVTAETLTEVVEDAQGFNELIGQADVSSSGNSIANKNMTHK